MTEVIRAEKKRGVATPVHCDLCGVKMGYTSALLGKDLIDSVGRIDCSLINVRFPKSSDNPKMCLWCYEKEQEVRCGYCSECWDGPVGVAMEECFMRQREKWDKIC